MMSHAVLEPINIDEEDMEFGDVDHGLLGIGKITMTAVELTTGYSLEVEIE